MPLHRRWGDVVLTSCARWRGTAFPTRLHVRPAKYPHSLIRVFPLRCLGSQWPKAENSKCTDAQANLSLHWAHMQSCRKCFAPVDIITKTCLYYCLYYFDPLKTQFYTVKLGLTGVYIIFLIFAQRHRLWVLVRNTSQVMRSFRMNKQTISTILQ